MASQIVDKILKVRRRFFTKNSSITLDEDYTSIMMIMVRELYWAPKSSKALHLSLDPHNNGLCVFFLEASFIQTVGSEAGRNGIIVMLVYLVYS